jgi:Tol biopolymer transport system component
MSSLPSRGLAWGALLLTLAVGQAHAAPQLVEFNQGTNLALDLSPDGRTLAIDLQGIVWTLPASGGAATPLTDPLWQAQAPRWTVDGTGLVFSALHPEHWNLWRIPADGAAAQQLTQGPYDDREPAMHPDGEHVVFVSNRSGSRDLWRLRLADGQLEQLSFHASDEAQPAISPDGLRIAYVSSDAQGYYLRLRSATGAQATLLSSATPLGAPSWRADGSLLMLVLQRATGRAEQVLILTGQETTLKPASWGEDIAATPAAWLDREQFFYTADGLVKRRRLGSRRAEVVPFFAVTTLPERGRPLRVEGLDNANRSGVHGLRAPRVSPDGQQVALTALGTLWVVGRDGHAQALVDDGVLPLDPAWSPDGRRLAFVADGAGPMGLYSIAADGSDLQWHAQADGDIHMPNWSPDGRSIAYLVSRDTERSVTDLAVVEPQNGRNVMVALGLVSPSRPEWVHGQRVVLARASGTERDSQLMAIDLPSGRHAPLPGLPPAGLTARGHDGPVASADGRRLAFVRDSRLWVAELDSYGEAILSARPVTTQAAASPSWAADNRTLVFLQGERLRRLDADSGEVVDWPVLLDHRAVSGDAPWVLQVGRLYDPAASGYRDEQDIFIEGQRIIDVVPRGARALPERVVDARAYTLLPGLIDAHTRSSGYQGERLGRALLAHGITSVREPASDPYDALERREAWRSGQRPGPRLIMGGAVLDGSGALDPRAVTIRSAAQLELEIERARLLGLPLLRSGERLPGSLRRQLVEMAGQQGIAIAASDVAGAAFTGATAVEGIALQSPQVNGWTTAARTDLAMLAARSGIAVTPLLGQGGGHLHWLRERPEGLTQQTFLQLTHVHERDRLTLALAAPPPTHPSAAHSALATIAGGGGLIGSGSGLSPLPPGLSLHAELQLLAASPLGIAGALRAATLDSAWALGAEGSLGSIVPGKLADMVLVTGDPLQDIGALGRIHAVISAGRYLPIDVLLMRPTSTRFEVLAPPIAASPSPWPAALPAPP